MAESDDFKRALGEAAAERIEDGMRLGIGTGSTAEAFIRALARRVEGGLRVSGVATSERSAALCAELGIPLETLETVPHLDLTVDGADEIDGDLSLIKGGGGALLREKIVAAASDRMLVIVDESKRVERLGAFPLPIEINGFGMMATFMALQALAGEHGAEGEMHLRHVDEKPFITDSGHLILDASFGRIQDAKALSAALLAVPGVVEHGLFLDMADEALVGSAGGVRSLGR